MKKISSVPITKLFPNIITILALCVGASALRYAFDEKWEISCLLIFIAAILDAIDGRIAALLNSTSKFGAQIDSISDVINFGFVPIIITYMWILNEIPLRGVGWFISLFYLTCSAIRLARFNVKLEDEKDNENVKGFFTGIPVPSAALLLLLPMMVNFDLIIGYKPNYIAVSLYVIFLGLMMVSCIPTFSIKKICIPRDYVSLVLLLVGIIITAILIRPWVILPILLLIYILSIPISILVFSKNNNKKSNS